MLLFAKQLG